MGQPNALKILIPTEIAQMYGYFSLQAILIFYLINALSYSDAKAYLFAGHFIALAYLTPVIGGWIADRFLGNRIAVLLGGMILCMGYALLFFGQPTLLIGLSLIIIGNGLFKSNIASFIGEFYHRHDARRESGFTLVYAGANIGSLLAIFSIGYIQKLFGWKMCFAIPSFVLLFGVLLFLWGFHYFNDKGLPPNNQKITFLTVLKNAPITFLWFSVVLTIIYYSIKLSIGNYFIYIFALFFLAMIVKLFWKSEINVRRHLLALMILFLIATYYKAMFFETYLVVNVFTDRLVDRIIWGYEVPATVFLSLGSLFTILLGPLFAYLWQSNKIILSSSFKFTLSILLVGIAMQMLAIWLIIETDSLLPTTSIILFRLIFAISELFILPIGLSVFTEYAPKHAVGLMIGGWYITAALGGKLAGMLANIAEIPKSSMSFYDLKIIYHHAFQQYALLNFILFIIFLMFVPIINTLLRRE